MNRFLQLVCLAACILLGITQAEAQNNTGISGVVTSGVGIPVSGITVTVMPEGTATYTSRNGAYEFTNVAAGVKQVIFTGVGYRKQVRTAAVTAGRTTVVNAIIEEAATSLQSVEITGRKEQGYKVNKTFMGSRTQTAIRDLPQSVAYVSKELMADQGSVRIGDIVSNMSGVSQFSFYDDLTIRGFRVNGQVNTQLVNGMRSSTGFWKQPLTNYLERVEVLKGPSSSLYGNASPGGIVNRVTKKPLAEDRKSVSVSMGSFNALRGLLDFTGPATKDSSLLYRLNLGYEDAQSFRDLQFDKNIVVAPSLSFIPDSKTRLNFDLVYNSSRSRLDRGQSSFANDLYSTPISLALTLPSDRLNENTYMVTVSGERELAPGLKLTASYLKTGYSEDLFEHRSANSYGLDAAAKKIPNLVAMQIISRTRRRFIDNVTAYLNYNVKTGELEQKLVLGYDRGSERTPAGASQMIASGYRNAANNGSISRYVPANKANYLLDKNGNPVPNIPFFNLNDIRGSQQLQDDSKVFYTVSPYYPAYYYLNAGYLQDQLKFKALQVLLGVRYEQYTDFVNYSLTGEKKAKSSVWLPRVGLVYGITDNVNVYGSYVQGYNPQTAASLTNPNAGGPFKPLESNSYEAGIKGGFFDNRLDVTAAVYRMQEKNVLYPAEDDTNPDLLRPIGKVLSKGVEFDVTGRILPEWSIIASYAFNRSYIAESEYKDEIGMQNPNAPKNIANLWTRYDFRQGLVKGLGLAAGVNFTDKRLMDAESTLPGYTIYRAAAFYTIGKMQLQLNVNNITNKKYWVGGYDYLRLFPGAPRYYNATLTYTFK